MFWKAKNKRPVIGLDPGVVIVCADGKEIGRYRMHYRNKPLLLSEMQHDDGPAFTLTADGILRVNKSGWFEISNQGMKYLSEGELIDTNNLKKPDAKDSNETP